MQVVGPVISHRPEFELRAELLAIAAVPEVSLGYREQMAGVDAAVRWVLGETTAAPISGWAIELPTWPQASMEADLADDATRGDYRLPDGAGREFANGVWIGISWAFAEIDEAPTSLG